MSQRSPLVPARQLPLVLLVHLLINPWRGRYIGVLNVTFQRQPRRKSTFRRDDAGVLERKPKDSKATNSSHEDAPANGNRDTASDQKAATEEEPVRMVSQSLSAGNIPVPTVTFDNNWHILPRNLLQPTSSPPPMSSRGRSTSASAASGKASGGANGLPAINRRHRPSLDDRHANSWGATTVNKKLRNEVFNDAFLKQPVSIQKHRRPYQRTIPLRAMRHILRPSVSDSRLLSSHNSEARPQDEEATVIPEKPPTPLIESQGDAMADTLDLEALPETEVEDVKDVTGTSAPEADILAESVVSPTKKRRYSGSGLRRKPTTVTESRGQLKYYEQADDAGYRAENEDGSGSDPRKASPEGGPVQPHKGPNTESWAPSEDPPSYASTAPSEPTSPAPEMRRIPRPVNPKEAIQAQMQRDSRVEYFLLLEDLTAGMKRPCIMDLKMGTRQYGVDANGKKQKSQQRKCAHTTSRELGVRVCGLQVWDVAKQAYIFKDKYYGRDLRSGQEFQGALTRFLYDGVDYSSVLGRIPTILQKLSQLDVIVRRLDGYRFYAASLLMYYDGDAASAEEAAGPDYDTAADDSTTDFTTDTEETSTLRESRRQRRRNKCEIDFKIADFANSVTAWDQAKGRPCPPKHPNEPDRGFLRGLASLRKYFLKIQRDVRAELGLDPLGRSGQVDVDSGISEDEGGVSE